MVVISFSTRKLFLEHIACLFYTIKVLKKISSRVIAAFSLAWSSSRVGSWGRICRMLSYCSYSIKGFSKSTKLCSSIDSLLVFIQYRLGGFKLLSSLNITRKNKCCSAVYKIYARASVIALNMAIHIIIWVLFCSFSFVPCVKSRFFHSLGRQMFESLRID